MIIDRTEQKKDLEIIELTIQGMVNEYMRKYEGQIESLVIKGGTCFSGAHQYCMHYSGFDVDMIVEFK